MIYILQRFHIRIMLLTCLCMLVTSSYAFSKPLLVTTVPALGQIAQAVGGIDINVKVITRIGHDPNVFSPRPGHARMLIDANLLFTVGFGLESSWLPALIELSGNAQIRPGNDGYLSGGDAIEAVGVPLGMSSDQLSDWSPDKNPYWWLDPDMGIKVANTLAVRLGELDTVNARRYMQRAQAFEQAVREALPRWRDYMNIHTGAVITYHSTYVWFMQSMHIELAGFIEPKPGIEPSTRYMSHLIQVIKEKNVQLIWVEPYNNRAIAKRLANAAGIKMMVLPDAVEGTGTKGYIAMFELMIERIARWSQ